MSATRTRGVRATRERRETARGLRVLANPAQRRALEIVAGAEISSGELAKQCGWSRPAASQNLRALRDARLVDVRVDGNRRMYRARPEGLVELRAFIDQFWAERLGRLSRVK